MAHYTVRNITSSSKAFSLNVFRMLATICESLVFVYIGTCSGVLYTRNCTRAHICTLCLLYMCSELCVSSAYTCVFSVFACECSTVTRVCVSYMCVSLHVCVCMCAFLMCACVCMCVRMCLCMLCVWMCGCVCSQCVRVLVAVQALPHLARSAALWANTPPSCSSW